MVNPDGSEERLTAAACAARTGLTIRALRVYERSGLLSPPRAHSGWREYGRRELARLNTIGVLKSAGLTLAQIRAVLHHSDPPLQEILQAQIQDWDRRKEDADRGKRTAQAALQRLQTHQALDVDLLCELIRSSPAGSSAAAMGDFLQRILALPAKEQAEWVSRHNEEINPRSAQDFQQAVRTRIDPALEKLMAAGAAPASPKVQKVILKYLDLMCRYHVRETAIKWLTGADAPDDTGRESAVPMPRETMARQVRPRLKHRPTEASDVISSQWTSNPFLVGYFAAAELHSAQCQAIDQMLLDAKDWMPADFDAHSKPARRLVEKFRALCEQHPLGDPATYARWAALFRPPPRGMAEAEDRTIWEFIADSIAASGSSKRK